MKILLTGGSGFVGTTFRKLIRSEVVIESSGQEVDLRDLERTKAALRRDSPDVVIHLAAQSSVPQSFADPAATMEINFIGTLNLLLALKAADFHGRFLFVGSGDVYGKVPAEYLPIVEQQPLRPRNPYAVSKVAAEALCFQWSQTETFELMMARPFNHIGAGQSERFVVSDFAKQVIEIKKRIREPRILVGDIDVTRDFLDVEDVVYAYSRLLDHGRSGETYNVCSGIERSIRSLLERLLELAGVRAEIVKDESRFRPSEQRRVVGSSEKLKKETSWSPAVSIDESLRAILSFWDQELG